MGLIGEYIGRIFLGICNNPQFVVRQIDEYGKPPYIVHPDGSVFVKRDTVPVMYAAAQNNENTAGSDHSPAPGGGNCDSPGKSQSE